MDFISNNTWLVGIVLTIAGIIGMFYVPFLRKLAVVTLKALLSEAVLKRAFLELAEKMAASTKFTKIDDDLVKEIKKRL